MLIISVRAGGTFRVGAAKITLAKRGRGKGIRVAIDAPREMVVTREKNPPKPNIARDASGDLSATLPVGWRFSGGAHELVEPVTTCPASAVPAEWLAVARAALAERVAAESVVACPADCECRE